MGKKNYAFLLDSTFKGSRITCIFYLLPLSSFFQTWKTLRLTEEAPYQFAKVKEWFCCAAHHHILEVKKKNQFFVIIFNDCSIWQVYIEDIELDDASIE